MKEGKNRDYEPVMTTYLRKVMCPICQTWRREVLLRSCGHAVCSKCMTNRHICPICKEKVNESDIKYINLNG